MSINTSLKKRLVPGDLTRAMDCVGTGNLTRSREDEGKAAPVSKNGPNAETGCPSQKKPLQFACIANEILPVPDTPLREFEDNDLRVMRVSEGQSHDRIHDRGETKGLARSSSDVVSDWDRTRARRLSLQNDSSNALSESTGW